LTLVAMMFAVDGRLKSFILQSIKLSQKQWVLLHYIRRCSLILHLWNVTLKGLRS